MISDMPASGEVAQHLPTMTIGARARMRPVLYPAAILLAFVLNLWVGTGVSPFAATRPLVVALVVGLTIPWAAGLATGDRHLAGLVGIVIVLLLVAPPDPMIAILAVIALGLVAVTRRPGRRRAGSQPSSGRWWPLTTRALTAGAMILLVAVGVKAVQLGRAETIAHDLVAEFPLGVGTRATTSAPADLPNMYLILLDGYPRADKLASEFGIDASWFIRGLDSRGFAVATHSRSNHTATRATLTQMFDYELDIGSGGADGDRDDLWRHRINEGRFFADIRGLGYEVVAVSPGWEHVALRQADHFIDTGQPNEFEWTLLQVTSARALIEALLPESAADLQRARVLGAFDSTEGVAQDDATKPRLVLTHVAAPHTPLLFGHDGSPTEVRGMRILYAESVEVSRLGWQEYVRRLDGQIAFLSARTLKCVDRIIALDPGAVIVVFSDHGSGVRDDPEIPGAVDADLRTANLLAVRSPGRTGIIEDRSTLANVLPRLLRAYAGIGPPDMPETIYVSADHPQLSTVFRRPD